MASTFKEMARNINACIRTPAEGLDMQATTFLQMISREDFKTSDLIGSSKVREAEER